jgi:uncharacterized membrane protein YhaH (DUF805 family)
VKKLAQNIKETAEKLKRILQKNPELLINSDELFKRMRAEKIGGGDLAAIQKALSYNIGDTLMVVKRDDAKQKSATEKKVREILQKEHMIPERIDFIIEVFSHALGWDEPAVNELPTGTELSLGNISIGDDLVTIHQLIGKEKAMKEQGNGVKIFEYDSIRIWLENGVVTDVGSYNANAKTIRGIHIGSTLQDVLSAYGDKYSKSENDNLIIYDYYMVSENHNGYIRFIINQDNKVELIYVSEIKQAAVISQPAEESAVEEITIEESEVEANTAETTLIENEPKIKADTDANTLKNTIIDAPAAVPSQTANNAPPAMQTTANDRFAALKKLFYFKGRINRKQYILRMIPVYTVAYVCAYIAEGLSKSSSDSIDFLGWVVIIFFISIISLMVRRLHDINKPWYWALLIFLPIPFSDYAVGLILGIIKGTAGANKYGEEPIDK